MSVHVESPNPFEEEPQTPAEVGRIAVEAQWKRDHDSRAPRGKTERRMLFAASGFARSVHALQRAYALATRWHGTLYVLHVARGDAQARKLGEHGAGTESAIAQAALRSVRRFCDRGLAEVLPRDHMLVKQGEFSEVVAETARELGAELVIIPGAERQKGNAVAQMAREAGVPVLVARRSALGGGILAATDLGDPGCDELRQAAALAAQAPGKLAFVHNVKPIVQAATTGLGHCMCTLIEPPAQALAECRERLQALATFFGVRADTLVVSRPSAEDAILEVARDNGADLIVVGARRQRWVERLFGTALAARIVDRCERSVLVAPLCDHGAIGNGRLLFS
jgi:nucleotide-binding universal stress UspA family protein